MSTTGKPQKLYKTTITIWTEYPTNEWSIEDLAREATRGDAYCESQKCVGVSDPAKFPQTEFFGDDTVDDD
jgi:hypothetical protein